MIASVRLPQRYQNHRLQNHRLKRSRRPNHHLIRRRHRRRRRRPNHHLIRRTSHRVGCWRSKTINKIPAMYGPASILRSAIRYRLVIAAR